MSLIGSTYPVKFNAEPAHVGQTEFVYEHSFRMLQATDADNIVGGFIKANNLKDPSAAFGTSDPIAFNEWANFYDAYRVLYCNIEIVAKAGNNMMRKYHEQPNDANLGTTSVFLGSAAAHAADQSNETMYLVAFPSESTTLLTDYEDILHHPRNRMYLIPSLNSGRSKYCRFSLGMKKYFEAMPADFRNLLGGASELAKREGISADDTFAIVGTTAPFEDWTDFSDSQVDVPVFIHLYLLNTDNSLTTPASLEINGHLKITYGVLCANKDELTV